MKNSSKILLSIVLLIFGGCKSDFNSKNGLEIGDVKSISLIQPDTLKRTVVDEKNELRFIFGELNTLSSRREGKVNPEFVIEFLKNDGSIVKMRMGKDCIGPNVPASDVAERWYFHKDTLYRFCIAKIRQGA